MKQLFIIILLIPTILLAQKDNNVSYRAQRKIKAKADIINIKNNVLLVRLSAKQNSINAMRKVGRKKLADKTEAKQLERNKAIVAAFRNNFSFCPIYFFYSEDSKFVTNNQLDSIHFLNDTLQVDNSIKVNNDVFYVVDFGPLEPETNDDNLNKKGQERYYTSSNITITALIIKDVEFKQLKKPFPYYVREFRGLPFQRAIFKMVQKMNEELNGFYTKNN